MGKKQLRSKRKDGTAKQNNAKPYESTARVSMLDGVPMLTYGDENNLREVTRCLSNKATLDFGRIGEIVEGLTYPIMKKIKYDPERLSADVIYRKTIELKLTRREAAKTK